MQNLEARLCFTTCLSVQDHVHLAFEQEPNQNHHAATGRDIPKRYRELSSSNQMNGMTVFHSSVVDPITGRKERTDLVVADPSCKLP